ncbi:MAG: glycosyltransferase family 2 protein [Dehalococcoidia bacterium]|nr:glycosyltransferase family 2 protein [Dehalococcoidia bacterium]
MTTPEPSPKVSVIIPTYNRAGLLPRAVNSVLAQSFQDFELLIVDDCSADDTPQVIAAFADPRIRALRHEMNRGLSAALNTGIANARGEFVAFLDDDDEFTPDSLADRLAALEASPPETAMAYGWCDRVDEASGEVIVSHRFTLEGAEAFEFSLRGSALGGDWSMLVRTSAARDVGGFDERLSLGADALFQCCLISKYGIIHVPRIVALAHEQQGRSRISTISNWDRMLEHHEIHRQRFSAEIDQRPGLRHYLARELPAHWMRLRAVYAIRQGAITLSLRSAVKAFTIHPLTTKNLRLPLHLLKGFLFYATPLRRFRSHLQRLLGQHKE